MYYKYISAPLGRLAFCFGRLGFHPGRLRFYASWYVGLCIDIVSPRRPSGASLR